MTFREDMLKQLRAADNLPALPSVVGKLTRMVNGGVASGEEIAKVLQLDPVMAGRLLRVANSAAFGGAIRVASIPQAVTRIGLRQVRDLVLSFAVMRLFKPNGKLDYRQFWRHSISVAYASSIVACNAKGMGTLPDEVFTAGLLHDMGILLMSQMAMDVYARVSEFAVSEQKDLYEAENEILGINHAEAGALLLEHWNVPALVTEVARYHHKPYPTDRTTSLLTKCVHLANFACNSQGIESGVGASFHEVASGAWYDTGLTVEHIPGIIDEMQSLVSTADELIGIAG